MRIKFLLIGCLSIVLMLPASVLAKNRILYVDSYHAGYAWSDGITEGIQSVLRDENVELKIVRMDTKRNTSEAFKRNAALEAKAAIESFRPQVVIASDDNASKYLIEPYYKNAALPFVFCGVNYSGEPYGYPYKNTTGMIEVAPLNKLIYSLKHFNRAEKIVLLASDTLTSRKEGENYAALISLPFDQVYVDSFDQWKMDYTRLQNEYDIMLVGNNAGIKQWRDDAAIEVVMSRTKIPTGCVYEWMTPFAFLGYTQVAQEQGRWSAQTALEILGGTPPSSIPMTTNKEGNLIVNTKVAKAAGIKVPKSFLKKASRVIE